MATYYAWSPIRHGAADGTVTQIKVGEEVSAKDLGVSDEEFQEYIDSGAVRTKKYPDIDASLAPAQHLRQLAAEAAAGNYDNVPDEEPAPEEDSGWAK